MSSAREAAREIVVWEVHRCPRCSQKWAISAPEGGSGNPILHMCPRCKDEIRCPRPTEHKPDCHCNFNPPREHA